MKEASNVLGLEDRRGTFTPAWNELGEPLHCQAFKVEKGSVDVGECREATAGSRVWPKIKGELRARATLEDVEAAGTSLRQWQQLISRLPEIAWRPSTRQP
ncbi:hypothetical protein CYMTET_42063 [Cymbomonas tetramitiformis]|uniref:Uncharacterized protein n=1 Tax=Cymbomonas tetramitiformis TaxID=36881 RepID=A0AAE0C4V7_9CHLO|nr:hypothetical protein CYMTET_42063 [Cymbomonas tetramitiformis]